MTPALILGLAVLAGCGSEGGESGETTSEPMPPAAQPMAPEVQDFVNQGNEAQRAGEYDAALDFYRQAMARDPEHPVPQFGALMAAMATGNEALADSLTQKLEATSPELLAMLRPDGSMGGGAPTNPHGAGMPEAMPGTGQPPTAEGEVEGLPPGHPVLYEVTPDTTQPDTAGVR